jgi:catechol 2,3-dioxygenase-like lactoylglutathione lyase family enzyme
VNVIQLKHEQVPLFQHLARRQCGAMQIQGFDHVGIRVSDRERALDFYASLGFAPDPEFTTDRVAEVVAADGTRINLIFNGVAQPAAHNILLDEAVKLPGYTHAAFIVGQLDELVAWAKREGVAVTEGPVDWGRRMTCFIRDPDGNVLEFNELKGVDSGS